MSENPEKILLSVKETSSRIGISERTLHTNTAPRGDIPCVKIGTRVFYQRDEIDNWILTRVVKSQ